MFDLRTLLGEQSDTLRDYGAIIDTPWDIKLSLVCNIEEKNICVPLPVPFSVDMESVTSLTWKLVFTESTLWADSVSKLQCSSAVCFCPLPGEVEISGPRAYC